MTIYGIGGQSGSGKSIVAKKLSQFIDGSKIIMGDKIYLETIWQHRDLAQSLFGSDAFVSEGVINSNIIWSQKEKYSKLKRVVLPKMRKKIIDMASDNNDIALLDWVYTPIMQSDCKNTILVEASLNVRHKRLLLRSKFYANEKYRLRDSAFGQMYKNFIPNFIIENNGNETALDKQIVNIVQLMNQ